MKASVPAARKLPREVGPGGGVFMELPFTIMAQGRFNVSIIVRPGLTVTSPAPPEATVGESYLHQFTATGGSGTYNWLVTGGAVPPGLQLTPAGLFAGTPTQDGSFLFEITVSG